MSRCSCFVLSKVPDMNLTSYVTSHERFTARMSSDAKCLDIVFFRWANEPSKWEYSWWYNFFVWSNWRALKERCEWGIKVCIKCSYLLFGLETNNSPLIFVLNVCWLFEIGIKIFLCDVEVNNFLWYNNDVLVVEMIDCDASYVWTNSALCLERTRCLDKMEKRIYQRMTFFSFQWVSCLSSCSSVLRSLDQLDSCRTRTPTERIGNHLLGWRVACALSVWSLTLAKAVRISKVWLFK